ncbi:flagellar biosynthesis protein FlaG [Bacillus canaveralius]|uniref:Flagellar biosynthesis protein FlaG n=1 Tax=Bacillus canaveralius TaxID=1403243 RepID=A0A2N5GMJ7_9BACI|nr:MULTISPECIES: flagellar protein FlaG [Bacillus]PLR82575.1 flagellar biosynthesis protein FlaG [Bacillus sp. V33-4]PLR83168.1 flagellar biosynthesis protein FlaG [Bacillus canaveralius]PLR94086.1 flagellar biosynthesis protein FlaG [Bacillus canaveralius]RSK54114.1 flagellar protein FlaG [Bacillus canaveralius]
MVSVDSISRSTIGEITVEPKSSLPMLPQEKESNTVEQQQLENLNDNNIKEEELDKAVKDLNNFLDTSHTHLKYVFHDKLERYYVTLIDDETKETVKEIPAKKLLDVYASMREYLGLFVDDKI